MIPALGSGRYSPGPNIVWPSWLNGSDPHCTINVFWGQPGALATVSLATGYFLTDGYINLAILKFKNDYAAYTESTPLYDCLHKFGFKVEHQLFSDSHHRNNS